MPQWNASRDLEFNLEVGSSAVQVSAKVRQGGDRLLLCLHGLGCTKESFDTAFDAIELSDFTICTFDFPGHGDSQSLPPGAYTIDAYADAALGVVGHLGTTRPLVLVGHSMGGAVGLVATQSGLDVSSFISVEGNLVADDCGLVSRGFADQPLKVFVEHGLPDLVRRLASSPRCDLRTWAHWYSFADPVAVHQIASSLVGWSDSGKLLELFKALRSSAYVYGKDNRDLSYVLSCLDGLPVRPIDQSGHFPMIDNPWALWQSVSTLIRGQESGWINHPMHLLHN